MKISDFLAFALVAFLAGWGITHFAYENRAKNADTETVIDVKVSPAPDGKRGWRYRGLLLNIDSDGRDNTDIRIGPMSYYRMGYHDGYYNYPQNPRYCDDDQYQRGYLDGQRRFDK